MSINPVRRTAVSVAGALLCLVGIALLVLPGPGLLVVLAGLVVLSTEYERAHRLLRPVRLRALQAAEVSVASPVRLAGSVLTGLVLIGLGIGWIVVDRLPLSGIVTGSSLILGGVVLLGLLGYSAWHVHRDARLQRRRSAVGVSAATRKGPRSRPDG
ncbi:MAG: hypothetical protein GEV09_01945 [Pseudonocardiaceae bacterium]|nr:hypothetical protein [Pseudonocardiaceae bacterium]